MNRLLRLRSLGSLGLLTSLAVGVPVALAACGQSTPSAPANATTPTATTPSTMDSAMGSATGTASATDTATAASSAPAPTPPTARADLASKSGTKIAGTATFVEQSGGGVAVTVMVTGAAPGTHGVHLHETPDCSAADAKSAGAHWNPDNAQHGGPTSASHHAGDFGNLTVGADGTGTLTLTVAGLTVAPGAKSVVGHSIIVHANPDDLKSQPAGNAGARGACGVISTGGGAGGGGSADAGAGDASR